MLAGELQKAGGSPGDSSMGAMRSGKGGGQGRRDPGIGHGEEDGGGPS